jgi:hypothetical protein
MTEKAEAKQTFVSIAALLKSGRRSEAQQALRNRGGIAMIPVQIERLTEQRKILERAIQTHKAQLKFLQAELIQVRGMLAEANASHHLDGASTLVCSRCEEIVAIELFDCCSCLSCNRCCACER